MKEETVAVVGLGYVGLPLATSLAGSGQSVFGIDVDVMKLNAIENSSEDLFGIERDTLSSVLLSEKLILKSNFEIISQCSIIIICVPTPIKSDKTPDLKFVESAALNVGKNLKKGALVILESTVSPGTTSNFLIPKLEEYSGLRRSEFDVVFSPERTDPGNSNWNLWNTPKLVAGLSQPIIKRATDLYSKVTQNLYICNSFEIAETAKLLENSFRYINISFINEFSIFCKKMGISTNEVIKAAATKPYGFMSFFPSIGVGGHCIPVDPFYLSNKADEVGAPIEMILLADQINRKLPDYYIDMANDILGGLGNKRILVVGISYKANVSDLRESPVIILIKELRARGAEVSWHDDLVKVWNQEKSMELSANFDLAILATPHDYLSLHKLGNIPVIDTRA